MESTKSVSVEDSQTSEGLLEELITKLEDADMAALSSQNGDQSKEEVCGYMYRSAGGKDDTIYVDSRGFDLNGPSLVVMENEDGEEIIVLFGDDDVQPPEQSFAHSFPNSDQVNFKGDLKEPGTLVMDEHSEWTDSNSGHLKNDWTEMLFIPNPVEQLEQPRKLVQQESQPANQEGSSICDSSATRLDLTVGNKEDNACL